MVTVGGVIWGIIIIGLGFMTTWKGHKIQEMTGSSEWFEMKLGAGGTLTAIRIGGLIVMAFGILLLSGKVNL